MTIITGETGTKVSLEGTLESSLQNRVSFSSIVNRYEGPR